MIEAVRAIVHRSRVPEDKLYERALRGVLARDFGALMDEIAEHQGASGATIGSEDALQLAVGEVRATRDERGSDS